MTVRVTTTTDVVVHEDGHDCYPAGDNHLFVTGQPDGDGGSGKIIAVYAAGYWEAGVIEHQSRVNGMTE